MAPDETTRITLHPASVAWSLGAAAAVLVVASTAALVLSHLGGNSPHEVRLAQVFYLDGERNLPTAFSTFLLLFAALLLAVVTSLERQTGARIAHWVVLTLGFLAMAVDEAWSFHERLNAPVRALLGGRDLGAYYYAWVVPALVLVLLLGLFFLRFLWRLPARTRAGFLLAAALYVGGALGVELIEGRFDELHGDRNLVSGLTATVQEALEMAGVIVFIRALLGHLAQNYRDVRLRFDRRAGEPTGVVS